MGAVGYRRGARGATHFFAIQRRLRGPHRNNRTVAKCERPRVYAYAKRIAPSPTISRFAMAAPSKGANKTAANKTAAKKSTAKKSAAKKSTAKSAAKKSAVKKSAAKKTSR